MDTSQGYILISIAVLLIIAVLVFFLKKNNKKKFTPLASLAFGFVIAGICFGNNRIVGYSLMGIGVILSIIETILKRRKKR
jgi:hypothetical protein